MRKTIKEQIAALLAHKENDPFQLSIESIRHRVSPAQVEKEFGPGCNEDGLTVYRFRSPDFTWAAQCGCAGFLFVKDGKVEDVQVREIS